MANRFTFPRESAFDLNGKPISGAKLEFLAAGTPVPADTFSDNALTVANTNPVIADSAGRFPNIFLQAIDYKVILKDAADVTIWTADPVAGTIDTTGDKFIPSQQNPADMTVLLGAGTVFRLDTKALVVVAAQTTALIVAPVTNPRNDIVFIDRLTGVVGVQTGVEAASPTDPTIPDGKLPVARVRLATTTIAITSALIDDIRELANLGAGDLVTAAKSDIQGQTFTAFDDTGVVNAYVITPVPAITAYAKYQTWVVDIATANTAASTMNINGLGVRNIFDFRTGAALVGGELAAGLHSFADDGTQLILMNSVVIPRLETYQFIEAADVTVNANFPTGVVWSSSQSINIPASGNMIFTVFARIDNADAAVRQFGFGLKIGGTNFWPQVDANGTATFNQYGVNVSEFRTWKGLSAPAAERTGLILNLDIEGHALPTGVQTVQPICAVNTGTSAHLIKGTLVTARMKLAVYNHA